MAPTAQTAADVTQALLAAAMGGKKKPAAKAAAKAAAKPATLKRTYSAALEFPYTVGAATVYKDEGGKRFKVKCGPGEKEKSISYRGPGEAAAWKTTMAYIADNCL